MVCVDSESCSHSQCTGFEQKEQPEFCPICEGLNWDFESNLDSKQKGAEMTTLSNVTPVLRSFDEAKAKEFYIDFLGFQVDFEHRFAENLPLYMGISRDDCRLHITEHHGDCSPGSSVRIATKELAVYQQELLAKAYKYARPGIETRPWGTKEMTIADPFGNRLTFAEEVQE